MSKQTEASLSTAIIKTDRKRNGWGKPEEDIRTDRSSEEEASTKSTWWKLSDVTAARCASKEIHSFPAVMSHNCRAHTSGGTGDRAYTHARTHAHLDFARVGTDGDEAAIWGKRDGRHLVRVAVLAHHFHLGSKVPDLGNVERGERYR